ncbi:MAG: hypothetical protein GKR92_03880 [Gammaproteobacteria bacterium]|nr:MAG: hypothetical protein GKR92_03880 [Gammaproteobacteria bacterium]
MKLSELFHDNPIKWGLQGDPYLWKILEHHFKGVDVPNSVDALNQILETAFLDLTEYSINYEKSLYIECSKFGGMLTGGVSPIFWKDMGFPIIVERYKALNLNKFKH